ncbi:hypothetical protein HPB47_014318, partial [Ixodes persulcatus]
LPLQEREGNGLVAAAVTCKLEGKGRDWGGHGGCYVVQDTSRKASIQVGSKRFLYQVHPVPAVTTALRQC